WKGWWGETPPYHAPVFVLTHHARAPIVMDGGTTFYFVTDGIHAALEPAIDAAGGKDVRLGGGVATIRQYLAAGLIDEMHLAISPVRLGWGEHLLAGMDAPALGYACAEYVSGEQATHVVLAKQKRREESRSVSVLLAVQREGTAPALLVHPRGEKPPQPHDQLRLLPDQVA